MKKIHRSVFTGVPLKIMVSALIHTTQKKYLNFFKDCTIRRNIPEQASDWPFAKKSSKTTEEKLRQKVSLAPVHGLIFFCRQTKQAGSRKQEGGSRKQEAGGKAPSVNHQSPPA